MHVGRVRWNQTATVWLVPTLHLGQVVQLRRLVRFELLQLCHVDAADVYCRVLPFVEAFVAQLVIKLSLISGWLIEIGSRRPPNLVRGVRLCSQITFVLGVGVTLLLYLWLLLIFHTTYTQGLLMQRWLISFVTVAYSLAICLNTNRNWRTLVS